jgi:hypothetical protein
MERWRVRVGWGREEWGIGHRALLLGIPTNMPGAIPAEIDHASFAGAPAPSGLSAEERSSYEQLVFFYKHVYYAFWMASRPQTMTRFADSPIGLATFLLDRDARSLELIARSFDGQTEGLTPDDVLDNVTLFRSGRLAFGPIEGYPARACAARRSRNCGRWHGLIASWNFNRPPVYQLACSQSMITR